MIKRGKNYLELDNFVILLNDNGYPVNTLYSHWLMEFREILIKRTNNVWPEVYL